MEHQRQLLETLEAPNSSRILSLPECVIFCRTLLGTRGAVSTSFLNRCVSQIILCLAGPHADNKLLDLEDIVLFLRLISKTLQSKLCDRQLALKLASMLLPMCHKYIPNMTINEIGTVYGLVQRCGLYSDLDTVRSVNLRASQLMSGRSGADDFTLDELADLVVTLNKKLKNSETNIHCQQYILQHLQHEGMLVNVHDCELCIGYMVLIC